MGALPENVDVTQLLERWGEGDKAALDRLIPLVHRELHKIARRCMAGERAGNSMQATALINEAYLKLIDFKHINWRNRTHFLAVAATQMRRILVDHARARNYQKRGGGVRPTPLPEEFELATPGPGRDIVALDDALEALASIDQRKSRVVELKFFGGLTIEEIAAELNVSTDTVMRDWRLAKGWLLREMKK